jgi:Heterokaryon incompatibility protein (HET)
VATSLAYWNGLQFSYKFSHYCMIRYHNLLLFAIQSMDVIYKQSTLSLGLLFVRIDSKEQVERFHDLMFGTCVTEWQNGSGKDGYSLHVSLQKARKVLDLLDLIIKDTWWERAWIFQEE